MLAQRFTTDTPFPLPGSTGYIEDTCEEVRVLQQLPGRGGEMGAFIVASTDRTVRGASGNQRVEAGKLHPTIDHALHRGALPNPRQSRRASRRRGA